MLQNLSSAAVVIGALKVKGLLGGIFHFYSNSNTAFCKQMMETLIRRRVLWRLIWVCAVCLCPTKKEAAYLKDTCSSQALKAA